MEQLKILNSSENLVAVFSNTLPDACPIIDFRQIQEAQEGGTYTDTCVLTVPANHTDAAYVVQGNFVLFQDGDGYWQEYKFVDVQRDDTAEESIITATGEHAFYELLDEPLDDIRPEDDTASDAVIQALSGTRWTIGTADDLGTNSCRIYKTNVLSGLKTIATAWGGELRFRLEVGANEIVGRRVDILTQRGTVTGKRFEFRKDLISVTQTVNRQNLATALIGRGKGEEVDGGSETTDPAYGRRLEFTDVVWTTPGDPADKPADQNWIGDDTAKAAYGNAGGTRHIYKYITFEDCTDAEELLTLTYNALQTYKVPLTTYSMNVIVLEEISGYEHEAVRLGDTVNVINSAVSPAITGQARVIYINRSWVDPSDCSVTIGNYLPASYATMANLQANQTAMLDRSGTWDRANAIANYTGAEALEYAIDLLTTQLSSTVSFFHTDSNGNFIFENASTFADSTAALKLGAGIFALANTKTGAEWDWRTFGTGDGFMADEITTGTLVAGIVFAGTLQAASGTFTSLTAGITGAQRMDMGYDSNNDPFIKFYDNSNTLNVTWLKTGFLFKDTTELRNYTIGSRSGIGIFGA